MSDLGAHTVAYFKLAMVKSSGKVKANGSNKTFDADYIKSHWFDFLNYLKENKIYISDLTPNGALYSGVNSLKSEISAQVVTDVEFIEYNNVQEFVDDNLERIGIIVDDMGRIDTDKSENTIDYLILLADQYNKHAKNMGWSGVNIALIDKVMGNLRFTIPKAKIKEIAESVTYDSEAADSGYKEIIKLLIPNASDMTINIHTQALKHYIWQIKRKLNGLAILDPLMIYVHGNQGIGKSSLIRHLNNEILGEFYLEQEVGDALDTRSAESKQNYYSVLADEIGYCDDATVSKIKKLLTSTYENTRILGSNAVMKVKNNTTWAATSNHSLMSTIYDETGLRRFWEISCTISHGEVLDFDRLAKINVVDLWKSVDETDERGYYNRELPLWKEMQDHQNKSVARSNAQSFLYMDGFLQPTDERYCWSSGKDIFRLYTEWTKENNIKGKGSSRLWFDRKLTQIGVQSVVFNRETYFWLNDTGVKIDINTDDAAPETKSVLISKEETKDLEKLVNKGFNKTNSITKLSNRKDH